MVDLLTMALSFLAALVIVGVSFLFITFMPFAIMGIWDRYDGHEKCQRVLKFLEFKRKDK